jgi:hypothetical protein
VTHYQGIAMKQGDIVKFKEVVDSGDETLRMVLLENPDGGRVLVAAIVDMNIKPTSRHNIEDLEVCGEVTSSAMLKEVVERMKREIKEDVKSGQVPRTVKTFSELHDYVDANEYGGFCDDEFIYMLTKHFGGLDESTGMPAGMIEFINSAQDSINVWINEGGLLE